MSHLLRQLHIMSSLKPRSDKELFPFYKTIAPILTLQPMTRDLHVKTVGKNLQLKTQDEKHEAHKKKPLAVILSWMLAKGSHIEKYCALYEARGFDVLTVTMTPKDLLFPTTGSQLVAKSLLDYLSTNKQYEKIFIHAFSVGGYLMGEIFGKMHEFADKYMAITERMSGIVCDSTVDFEGIPTGFPRAVSENPITVKVLEWYINAHLTLMQNVATKHYLRSSKNFHNTPLRCPALFLVSEADKVGTPASNQKVADNWIKRGVDVKMKCWKDSKHVSHMHLYKDEYIGEIDRFLLNLDLK